MFNSLSKASISPVESYHIQKSIPSLAPQPKISSDAVFTLRHLLETNTFHAPKAEMRIEQSYIQRCKAVAHGLQALMVFIAGCIMLAVFTKDGSTGSPSKYYFAMVRACK